MKYENSIVIEVPLKRFVELLDNPENMKYWQKGLQSYEILDGESGKVGSTMRMNYLQGKREMSLLETVTVNNLPHEFSATYECKGVWNLVENHFTETTAGHTQWTSVSTFKFTGMMKIMSWFMPTSMFRKQSCQMLDDFKSFAEQ